MWTLRRNQWVTLQSFLWLPLLTLAALSPLLEILAPLREGSLRSGPLRTGWNAGLLGLGLLSYLQLAYVLGAGRTIADGVTLARFGLILAGAGGMFVLGVERSELWLLLVAGVSLDLVDGWAARRFGATEEGAVLDMETDQLTTLYLSLMAHDRILAGEPPLWAGLLAACFLVLPALKYGFALGLRHAPRVNDPKPGEDNTRGRRICATVLIGLLACTAPVLEGSVSADRARLAVGVLLSVLLGSSFVGDLRHVLGSSTGKEASNSGTP